MLDKNEFYLLWACPSCPLEISNIAYKEWFDLILNSKFWLICKFTCSSLFEGEALPHFQKECNEGIVYHGMVSDNLTM